MRDLAPLLLCATVVLCYGGGAWLLDRAMARMQARMGARMGAQPTAHDGPSCAPVRVRGEPRCACEFGTSRGVATQRRAS